MATLVIIVIVLGIYAIDIAVCLLIGRRRPLASAPTAKAAAPDRRKSRVV